MILKTVKKTFKTLVNFTKNIKTTGAIYKTSSKVEDRLTQYISNNSKVVVEFGPGYGNVTKKILSRLPTDGKLYCFEVNTDFVKHLKEEFNDDRLVVINDEAQNFQNHLNEPVDYFISTIPLSFLTEEVTELLISRIYESLTHNGYFCKAQYSSSHFGKFEKVFGSCISEIVYNIPPAHIIYCRK